MTQRLTAALACAFCLCACGTAPPRFSGTVETEYASVGSQIGGRVIETDVSAGQRVRRGSRIVRLDPAMLRAQYDEAVAQERAAQAALTALDRGTLPSQIAQARGTSAAAGASLNQTLSAAPARIDADRAALATAIATDRDAEREYQRTAALVRTGDMARQSLDQALAARDRARAGVRQARAALDETMHANVPGEAAVARANAEAARSSYSALLNGAQPAQIAQAREQLRNAQASVNHAIAQLREASVYSPVDGIVASFNLHPGDMLGANQVAAVIDTFADPYVYIYASQRDLGSIRDAKRLAVHSDSGVGTFEGTVAAYDRVAQFTPQSVETADQRAGLVYGVKVRIHDPHHELLDGTTVTVEIQ